MVGELLKGLISPVTKLIGGYQERRHEIKKAKHDLKIAEFENRARLMRDKQSYNHEWEMSQLADKDKFLRWFSFLAFTAPFIVAMHDPALVTEYFEGISDAVPLWWQQILVVMIGGVWGIASLKNIVPQIVGGVKNIIKK